MSFSDKGYKSLMGLYQSIFKSGYLSLQLVAEHKIYN